MTNNKFQTKQRPAGYINFGLTMTPEKTETFAESLVRCEMTQDESTIASAIKSAKVTLLLLGFDYYWVEREFKDAFTNILYKHKQN